MSVDERNPSGAVRLQEAEMETMEDFKYLGSTVQRNRMWRRREEEVGAGWNEWRKESGVIKEHQQE